MIVIIGLVPDEVGKALASPIQTPGRVVQLAPRAGDARLRVAAHAAGAHLVGREQLEAPGAQRHSLEPLEVALDVVADAPLRQAGGERRDLARARRHVQAHLRGERAVGVCDVERVVERVQGSAWPSASIVTRPPPWSRTRPMKVAP